MAAVPKPPTNAVVTPIDRLVATVETVPTSPTRRMSLNKIQRNRMCLNEGWSKLRGDHRYAASTTLPIR